MVSIPTKITGDSLTATEWNTLAEWANRTFDLQQSSGDLNTDTDTGIYHYASTTTNRPPVSTGGMCLVVENTGSFPAGNSQNAIYQIAFDGSNGIGYILIRFRQSGTWTSWAGHSASFQTAQLTTTLNNLTTAGALVSVGSTVPDGPGFPAYVQVLRLNSEITQQAFGLGGELAARTYNGSTWGAWAYAPRLVAPPESTSAPGKPGNFAASGSYIYVYTGNGTSHGWVRASASTW